MPRSGVLDSDWELLPPDWAASISPEEPDPYLKCDPLHFPPAGCRAVIRRGTAQISDGTHALDPENDS